MPITAEFEQPSTFVLEASDRVTLNETLRTIDELLGHPHLSPGTRILIEGRSVTHAPSSAELRIIAREIKVLLDYGVVAIAIVTGHTFVYGVARLFAAFAEAVGANVGVFRSPDQARRWLSGDVERTV